jgi:hypothetical protein
MNRWQRFLEQGACAYAAFLFCEGIVEYIPCSVGKVCEVKNYQQKRKGN